MNPVVRQAERELAQLRAARDAATANLVDLESDGTYTLLKAGDGLSGVTAARARPALAEVAELWRGLELLDGLLARADVLRGNDRLRESEARELTELLTTDSITLPPEPLPLAERGLTTAAVSTRTISPRDLLDAMEAAFTPLRDVVAEVEAAWRDLLPRLEQAAAEAGRLADALPGHRGVARAQAKLRRLAARVAEDPLGAAQDLARVEADLAGVREALAWAENRARELEDNLVRSRRAVDELEALLAAGRDGLARTRTEIARPRGLLDSLGPEVVQGPRGLRPWLERLERLVADGHIDRAYQGYGRWRTVADRTLAAARQVAEANTAPARRRHELRGLLRAARAKAGASGLAEDARLTELARAARQALAVPCDLAAAERLVGEYLAELRREDPA